MKSMTGYGRAKLQKESREYIVEIKSVNHKYLLNIKYKIILYNKKYKKKFNMIIKL